MEYRASLTLALASVAFASLGTAALADEGDAASWSLTAGLRIWSDEWEGNSFPLAQTYVDGKPVLRQAIARLQGTSTVAIPTVAVGYGNWSVTAASTLTQKFDLNGQPFNDSVNRRENDLSVAYYITPRLNVGLGYKDINWNNTAINGPVVSVGGSAPLAEGLALYAGAGLGHLRAHPTTPGPQLGTNYFVSEIGLSYALGTLSPSLKHLSALVAYRSQRITARGAALSDSNGIIYIHTDVTDQTSGPLMGLMMRY